jgi:hypothetical protein
MVTLQLVKRLRWLYRSRHYLLAQTHAGFPNDHGFRAVHRHSRNQQIEKAGRGQARQTPEIPADVKLLSEIRDLLARRSA